MARRLLLESPDARIGIHSRVNRHRNMSNDIIVSRKDVREALVRTALKDEFFRDSLVANPKLAVERALGTELPEDMEVVVLQDADDKMFIVLPMQLPFETGDLSDAELEKIAGGFLDAGKDSSLMSRAGLI
jgi:Nitrile hydratase, alpha chain